MTLGDVLRELGDSPLQGHKWTDSILSNLNSILPSAQALTPESTGRDALKAVVMLPEAERDQLLASSVDLIKGTLTLTETSVNPAPKEEDKSEEFHRMMMKEIIEHPKSALTLMAALFVTLSIIVVVIIMTIDYMKHGKNPDTNLFVTLIKALIDLFSQNNGG